MQRPSSFAHTKLNRTLIGLALGFDRSLSNLIRSSSFRFRQKMFSENEKHRIPCLFKRDALTAQPFR